MKKLIANQRGIVYLSIVYISLIILTILMSLLYLISNNIASVISNADNYRANYITESILELKIAEINELSEEVIMEYLLDLKQYKSRYIELSEDEYSSYNPPKFSTYIRQKIIPNAKKISGTINNPFEEYDDNHYFKINVEYDNDDDLINIKAEGSYRRARTFIRAKLELPKSIEYGIDEYNLPKIKILSINIVQYYQVLGE